MQIKIVFITYIIWNIKCSNLAMLERISGFQIILDTRNLSIDRELIYIGLFFGINSFISSYKIIKVHFFFKRLEHGMIIYKSKASFKITMYTLMILYNKMKLQNIQNSCKLKYNFNSLLLIFQHNLYHKVLRTQWL
jgi:hypothetical protein